MGIRSSSRPQARNESTVRSRLRARWGSALSPALALRSAARGSPPRRDFSAPCVNLAAAAPLGSGPEAAPCQTMRPFAHRPTSHLRRVYQPAALSEIGPTMRVFGLRPSHPSAGRVYQPATLPERRSVRSAGCGARVGFPVAPGPASGAVATPGPGRADGPRPSARERCHGRAGLSSSGTDQPAVAAAARRSGARDA